MKLKDFE